MNIEPLESRIAPAAAFTYMDLDGDIAVITTSQGTTADLTEANGVLTFSAPDPGAPDVPRQLYKIDLSLRQAVFEGTDLSIKVTRKAPGGDGLVHVGFIDAREQIPGSPDESVDLGNVFVGGDLGKIEAGAFAGVKSLTVRSLGVYGLATQGGTGDLLGDILGKLGVLTVSGDVRDARLQVDDSVSVEGSITSVTVGGSISGVIQAGGDVGAVKIAGDVRGVAGSSGFSGALIFASKVTSITIGGSLLRGDSMQDGLIFATSVPLGVKIGGDFTGSIGLTTASTLTIGGSMAGGSVSGKFGSIRVAGDLKGMINAVGTLPSISIGGSIFGGSITAETLNLATITGSIVGGSVGAQKTLVAVKIGGDLSGGSVFAGTETNPTDFASIGSVTIGGSFIGVGNTGRIFSNGTIGAVKIGGSVLGDSDGSATIRSYQIENVLAKSHITSVTIGGSLVGGPGIGSAEIDAGLRVGTATAGGNLGPVSIRGSVLGGGQSSGFIRATGTIGTVKIGGSLTGGSGVDSGEIFTQQAIGAVTIGRDLRGGTNIATGLISGGSITSVTVGGSLIGGTGNLSGAIFSVGDLGPVKIGRDLQGGSIAGTAANLDRAGYIKGGHIASVTVGGSILGGFDTSTMGSLTNNASIRADLDIGAITVKGSIDGTFTANGVARPAITALGQARLAPGATTDLAIKSITVGGRVSHALILAGFDVNDSTTAGTNANASIGSVSVGGDWIATSISAGVNDTNGNGFGNDDQRIAGATLVSRIASITIKGTVAGTAGGTDHFGFTAAQIGSFQALGFTAKLKPLPADPKDITELSLVTGDVTLREV